LINLSIVFGTWDPVQVLGFPPSPRYDHAASVDPQHKDYIVVYGGKDENNQILNDMFLYHISQDRWEKIFHRNNEVPSLCGHTINIYQDTFSKEVKAYIFGGEYEQGLLSDVLFCASLEGNREFRIVQPTSKERPCPRRGHRSILIGKQLLVFGGQSKAVPLSDIWVYNIGMF
jgi:hypothetical protein